MGVTVEPLVSSKITALYLQSPPHAGAENLGCAADMNLGAILEFSLV